MDLLAFDPGTRNLGWAVFKNKDLVNYGTLSPPFPDLSLKSDLNRSFKKFRSFVKKSVGVQPTEIVIERLIARPRRSTSTMVEKVTVLVAWLAVLYPSAEAYLVPPATWKSWLVRRYSRWATSYKTCSNCTTKCNRPGEVCAVFRPRSSKEQVILEKALGKTFATAHEADATGLGLYWLERRARCAA